MKLTAKIFLPAIIAVLCVGQATAQTAIRSNDTTQKGPARIVPPVKPKRPKPIHTEFSVGLRLNTDGWSIFADRGTVKSQDKYSDLFYDVKLMQVEFTEHKHPMETKRSNTVSPPNGDNARPFIFGKINNFYALKLGYGRRKMIAGKPEQGNISIHWVYAGGLTLGLLKPYYIDAYVPIDNSGTLSQETIKYSDSTKGPFLTKPNIMGSAGFMKGLGETQIVPGIHLKTALHFDFAASKRGKVAIETGVNAEFYSKKIEIMANQEARAYLVNVYASIQFGRRK
jgi:hypothetical protein